LHRYSPNQKPEVRAGQKSIGSKGTGAQVIRCTLLIKVTIRDIWSLTPVNIFLDCIAVEKAIEKSSIKDKMAAYQNYLAATSGKSNNEARDVAKDILGESVFWDWDRKFFSLSSCYYSLYWLVPRTKEGYYHYNGGIEASHDVIAVHEYLNTHPLPS
jgi:Isocitrate lyase family